MTCFLSLFVPAILEARTPSELIRNPPMKQMAPRTKNMKDSFGTFKTHLLDLAVTATSDAPNGQKSWKLAASQAVAGKVDRNALTHLSYYTLIPYK